MTSFPAASTSLLPKKRQRVFQGRSELFIRTFYLLKEFIDPVSEEDDQRTGPRETVGFPYHITVKYTIGDFWLTYAPLDMIYPVKEGIVSETPVTDLDALVIDLEYNTIAVSSYRPITPEAAKELKIYRLCRNLEKEQERLSIYRERVSNSEIFIEKTKNLLAELRK